MSSPTKGLLFFPNKAIISFLLRCLYELLRLCRDDSLDGPFAVPLHPAVQQVFLETPAISELEGHSPDLVLAEIFVKCVWRDSEIFGRLTQRHHFLLSIHFMPYLSHRAGFICYYLACFTGSLPCVCPVFWTMSLTVGPDENKNFLRIGPKMSSYIEGMPIWRASGVCRLCCALRRAASLAAT